MDLVYSLHACDSATDKSIYTGIKNNARCILSVSCCQHSLIKNLRNKNYTGITRHPVFKDKITYIVGDSMRAMLLEMNGYRADILEFVSSRYTDKNVMIRAVRDKNIKSGLDITEYDKIKDDFRIQPELENYLKASG